MNSDIYCPYCGEKNPEAANYCKNCGQTLIEKEISPEALPSAKFYKTKEPTLQQPEITSRTYGFNMQKERSHKNSKKATRIAIMIVLLKLLVAFVLSIATIIVVFIIFAITIPI